MQTRAKLKPGQKGTRKLLNLYGAKLVCVRYRYDKERQKRFTTVELIVDEAPWRPVEKRPQPLSLAQVRIAYGETSLIRQVKAAGGRWNYTERVWELPQESVTALGLEARLVAPPGILGTQAPRKHVEVSNTRNHKASKFRN